MEVLGGRMHTRVRRPSGDGSRQNPVRKVRPGLTTLDVRHKLAESLQDARQDQLYQEAAATFSAALERVATAYEADPNRRQDLLQDIHLALWRSFEHFS